MPAGEPTMTTPALPATIQETKHYLDGRSISFNCALVQQTPRLVIVRFDHPAARTVAGFHFREGSHTIGFFWPGRTYNLYRFTGPDGAVIAYRLDVVDGVRLRPGHVRYTDLLLDAWVAPDGRAWLEDEEEVAAADAEGLLSPRRRAIIARTARLLLRAHARIIGGAEVELAAVAVAPPDAAPAGSA